MSFDPPRNRMLIAALSLIGVLIAIYTLLYSMGFLGQLACGTGGCETVQLWAKDQGLPVPGYGVAGYGLMLIVAIAGLQPGLAENRLIPPILIAGALIATAFTAYLTYLEAYVIHAWCRWCLASAVLVIMMLIAVVPEFTRLRSSPIHE